MKATSSVEKALQRRVLGQHAEEARRIGHPVDEVEIKTISTAAFQLFWRFTSDKADGDLERALDVAKLLFGEGKQRDSLLSNAQCFAERKGEHALANKVSDLMQSEDDLVDASVEEPSAKAQRVQ